MPLPPTHDPLELQRESSSAALVWTRAERRLRFVARTTIVALAALQTVAWRYFVALDGVSYLDLADAWRRGEWAQAFSSYWSPLYSWLLALALALLRPSARLEAVSVHGANFCVFLASLLAFEFLLRGVLRWRESQAAAPAREALPRWLWLLTGYTVFAWSSLRLVGLASVTPDLCVTVLVYLAAGLLVRVPASAIPNRLSFLLGLVLGCAFLAKAAMLPISAAFLLSGALAAPRVRPSLRRTAVAAAGLALIAVSYVVLLSTFKQRPTWSDAAKLNYAWFVNGVQGYTTWQGGPPGNGSPLHPPRVIHHQPATYEYDGPVAGTYPLWYDPSYWYDGVRVRFRVADQLRALRLGFHFYYAYLMPFLFGVAGLVWLGLRRRATIRLRPFAVFGLPAFAGFALYALVHVESRFVAAFVTLLMLALLMGMRAGARFRAEGMEVALGALCLVLLLDVTRQLPLDLRLAASRDHPDWEITTALQRQGVTRGSKLALVFGHGPYWARLGGWRVVGEVSERPFWAASAAAQDSAMAALARSGADFLLTTPLPGARPDARWRRVGDTKLYLLDLRRLIARAPPD